MEPPKDKKLATLGNYGFGNEGRAGNRAVGMAARPSRGLTQLSLASAFPLHGSLEAGSLEGGNEAQGRKQTPTETGGQSQSLFSC